MGIKPERMKPENKIEVVYNGMWALIDVEKLGPGDHLVTVEAKSDTYYVGATLAFNCLF